MAISELGYIILGTPDVDAWRGFARDVLGMMVSETGDGLRLKMDERDFRFLIVPHHENRFLGCGWLVADREAFAQVRGRLGSRAEPGDAAGAAMRRVHDYVSFRDPAGNPHEIGWGPISDFAPFRSPAGVSGFVTGDLGLGHAVLPATDLEETFAFWRDELGFGLCDTLTVDRGTHKLSLYFTHCGNPRQHSMALGNQPSAVGCLHMMIEVATLDDLGRALDRVTEADLQMVMTLGQHVNDECVSFYFRGPGGFTFEIGWAAIRKDWSKHVVFETTLPSHWGHRFVLNDPRYQPRATAG
jgi:3,4-dihydroxy-9,10-secoandrosta-1,3,5(10)-triene-9,17-dione 4,5-dioxygenase